MKALFDFADSGFSFIKINKNFNQIRKNNFIKKLINKKITGKCYLVPYLLKPENIFSSLEISF